MAEKEKHAEQIPGPVNSDKGDNPGGLLHSIIVVILALLVVAAVSSGVFFFAVKNNLNGLADTLKPQIKNHPILKLALPREAEPIDPDSPELLTEKELIKKYNEYRARTRALQESLDKANETIRQLSAGAQSAEQIQKITADNKALLESINAQQAQLEAEKKAFSELIAQSDAKGFKEYFEKVDKKTAQEIYQKIMEEEKLAEEKVQLAKPFSQMEPKKAAGIFAEMYIHDKETLLDILEGMKPDAAALILENLEPKTAAEIYKLLSDRKLGR